MATTQSYGIEEHFHNIWNYVQNAVETAGVHIQDTYQEYETMITQGAKKAYDIALPILKTLGATILFLYNSSLFVIGGVAAALFPTHLQAAIERITSVWNRLEIPAQSLIFAAAVFAWPISLAVSAFFVGAHISLYLQKSSTSHTEPTVPTTNLQENQQLIR